MCRFDISLKAKKLTFETFHFFIKATVSFPSHVAVNVQDRFKQS